MTQGKRTLQIVSPCPAAWEEMRGAAERRHCDHCDKAVHDLSAMAPEVAAELLEWPEPVCVRVRCSADGTVLHSVAPEKSAARARLQLLVTPALLAAMAACGSPADAELPLVVDGPPASTSPASVVAPLTPARAVEQSEPQAPAQPASRMPQIPTPETFLTGATVAFNDQSGPLAPKLGHTQPQQSKPARSGEAKPAPKLHRAAKHPERPRPDWLMERDRQPRQEHDSELECMGVCL